MVRYFAFDTDTGMTGLVRYDKDDKARTFTIETAQEGKWVDTPDAYRYFEGFGGDQTDLIELTADQAQAQAAELGVPL